MNSTLTAATENVKRFFGLDIASDYEEETYYDSEPTLVNESSQPASFFQPVQKKQEKPVKAKVEPEVRVNQHVEYATKEVKETPVSKENNKIASNNILSMEKTQTLKNRYNTRPLQPKEKMAEKVSKITVLEPRTYNEAKSLADALFRNEIVIISFRSIEEAQARRIVDFLTGAVYAIDGDIQRLDSEMFICTPPNAEVDSDVAKSLIR